MVGTSFMTMPKRFVQAYRQAPWRIQTQRVALLLILAILGASMVWVMLSVTVQAATAGLTLQNLELSQEVLQREVADLNTRYAILTSAERMTDRAEKMGFEPVSPENLTYVVVPGYAGRQTEIQAPPPSNEVKHPLIKPGYTQSLWEWMIESSLTLNKGPQP